MTDLELESAPLCFREEPFCAVLSEVAIASDDRATFLAAVAPFLNERVWGTLNAMLLVPSAVERDPELAAELDGAIEALEYGSVCVNVWPAVAYGLGTLPWGGHRSGTLADVQSGLGYGHNSLLLQHGEKSVLRGPRVQFPKPFFGTPDTRRSIAWQSAGSISRQRRVPGGWLGSRRRRWARRGAAECSLRHVSSRA